MDFIFNEDQLMLRDSIERYLTKEYGLSRRETILKDAAAGDRLWREIAELGWIGAAFPAAAGGFGGGPLDIYAIMELFGRHLFAEPFLWTAIIGGRLLLEAGRHDLIERVVAGNLQLALGASERHAMRSPEHVATTAEPSGNGFVINGRKQVVLNGGRADLLLVAARTGGGNGDLDGVTLFAVPADAAGVSRRGFRMIDGHPAAEITLERVTVDADAVLGDVDRAVPMIERATDHGIAALCAETAGSAGYLVETTAAYIKTREQYGAPIAKFQVVQHRMADMYVATEMARSMAFMAAHALALDDAERARDVSAAKVQVSRNGLIVGKGAVQLHGGMGVSEELDVAHHFKRLTTAAAFFGDEGFHLQRFATLSQKPAAA